MSSAQRNKISLANWRLYRWKRCGLCIPLCTIIFVALLLCLFRKRHKHSGATLITISTTAVVQQWIGYNVLVPICFLQQKMGLIYSANYYDVNVPTKTNKTYTLMREPILLKRKLNQVQFSVQF